MPDLLIGIANPAYVGFKVRRAAKLLPVFICNQHTRLAGHQFGAEIIRMAAEPWHPPALLKDWAQQGTQIGQKAIVPHHQFVELTAGREILIFKAARLSLGSGAQQANCMSSSIDARTSLAPEKNRETVQIREPGRLRRKR